MPRGSLPNLLVGAAWRLPRPGRGGGPPAIVAGGREVPYSESLQSLRAKRSISHEHQKSSGLSLAFVPGIHLSQVQRMLPLSSVDTEKSMV